MKINRLRSECLQCMLKNHLAKCPKDASEELRVEYTQKLMRILSEAPKTDSAPVVVRRIEKLQRELFGIKNEFGEVKRHFNQVMLGKVAEVQERIDSAEDSLKMALKSAMVGNYIDFGAMIQVDETYLTELLRSAAEKEFDEIQYQNLKTDLSVGKKLVILTDNCGEIVMDKLLIREIQKRYPHLEITVIVRGMPALNDATMEDAVQVGLTQIVKVIGNGNDIAGTCLEELSEEARAVFEDADVVLAKGQGNYETLRGEVKNIYYLFLCKCDMFSQMFGVPRLTGMLVNETK